MTRSGYCQNRLSLEENNIGSLNLSQFEYVEVLVSIIVGLALTQILRGVGRIVTTKTGPPPYRVHLVWTLYLFIFTTLFWWWEFQLSIVEWTMPLYFVVIVYATLLFFISLVLHPSNTDDIENFEDMTLI